MSVPRASSRAVLTTAESAQESVFEGLFEDHFTYVWNLVRRFGIRDAEREDLVQEVFVRVHRAMPTYDATRAPRPWLFAFAFRVASEHRKLARNSEVLTDEPPEVPSVIVGPEGQLDDARRRARLHEALRQLDPEKRAVIILHELDERPIPEVALTLGIPEGTAYTRLRAARAELSVLLGARLPPARKEDSPR